MNRQLLFIFPHSVPMWTSYLSSSLCPKCIPVGSAAPGMSVHVRNATAGGSCTTKTDNDNRTGAAFNGFSTTTNGASCQPLDKARQPWSRLTHWYIISSHLRSVLNHSTSAYCHLEGNSESILIYGFVAWVSPSNVLSESIWWQDTRR